MDGAGAPLRAAGVRRPGRAAVAPLGPPRQPALRQPAGSLASHLFKGVSIFSAPCAQGLTALHFAADRGLAEACALLAGLGAQLDALDPAGQSPLFYAAICDHIVSLSV
jgi:hypothetical protein